MTFPLPYPIKARLEAGLIRLVIRILRGRNVARAPVVSRSDNNLMWGMSEQLEEVADRIASRYQDLNS